MACSLASAQTSDQLPGFDLERLETNIGRGTVLMGNGELMKPSGLSVSLLGHYQRQPLVLNDGKQDLQIVSDRATALLSASYGVLSWLELGAQVPFVLWQQGADPKDVGLSSLSAQGIGTPVLQARLGVLSRRRRQPVDLSADLGVGLPFGTGTALAGDDGPRFQARMTVGTEVGWIQPSLEAGVLFRPNILLPTSQEAVRTGASSEVRIGAALATTGKGLRGELGFRATFAKQVFMEALGGVRFPLLAGLDGFVLGGPGVGSAPGVPRFRVLAGISFRNEPPPPISFLDERADRELQLVWADRTTPKQEEAVRAVQPWELTDVRRGEGEGLLAESQAPQATSRPYQPGPTEKLVLRGEIHFAQGSSELPGVVPLLDQAVIRLSEQARACVILVEGHSDNERTESYTAVRRAQAIRRYLISQGVPATQVQIRSFGSAWPISAQPATDQERQLNRRAEVFVITDSTSPLTTQAPPP